MQYFSINPNPNPNLKLYMVNLRSTVRTAISAKVFLVFVLVVTLLQAILLAGLFYIRYQEDPSHKVIESIFLGAYTALVISIAIYFASQAKRWMSTEDSVRQRLLDVIDAIPDPAAVRDAKGRYIIWNREAEKYQGLKAVHVLGKTPFDIFPAAVAREILEIDAECSVNNTVVSRRVVLPALYGKGQRIVNLRASPIQTTSENDVRGVLMILRDITQEETEAAKMRHLTTQLKMALDTSGFGSWIWDLESNVVNFSGQYKALLRYKGDNFRQDFEFKSRLHPDDLSVVLAAAKHCLETNDVFDQVYRLRGFDEVYRIFHASGECAFDDKGRRYFAGLLCPLDRKAD
jgi:PAS domain S-box-containing protein